MNAKDSESRPEVVQYSPLQRRKDYHQQDVRQDEDIRSVIDVVATSDHLI